jgi:hypothetical protein
MNNIFDKFKKEMPLYSSSTEHKFVFNGCTVYGIARLGEEKFVLLCETNDVIVEREAEPIELENIWTAWMYDLKSTYDLDDEVYISLIIKPKSIIKSVWGDCSVVPEIKVDKIVVFKYHRLDSTEETGVVCCADPNLFSREAFARYLYSEYARTFDANGIDYSECDLKYAIDAILYNGDEEAIIVNYYVAISYSYNYFLRKI